MALAFENQELDLSRRELRRDGKVVAMEPQVFDLVVYLVENRERVVSKDDLIEGVWRGRIVSESTLTSRINAARKALGDSGEAQRLIRTMQRKGFRFVGDVRNKATTGSPSAPRIDVQASPELPDKPSIAVLPFQNMSGEAEQAYFVDGLVEDITTALSRISWFFVIARNSSFTYRGKAVDVRQVGRELGVRYVVEGSVRRSGQRLRITGQLVDTASGAHVWAERYDGAMEDVFDLQDRITSSIVAAIEPKVRQAEINRAQSKSTTDLSAYDLVLRAMSVMAEYRRERHHEALGLLDQALSLDPRYSLAHALKARIYIQFKAQNWGDVDEAEALGLVAAGHAIATGPDDPNSLVHGGGAISFLGSRHEEGLAHCERALELNPNHAHAARSKGWAYWFMGRHERAIRELETWRRFSPVDPGAFDAYVVTACALCSLGRPDEAVAWAERAVRERPQWAATYIASILAGSLAGRPRAYLAQALEGLRHIEPNPSVRSLMRRFPVDQATHEFFTATLRKAGLPD